MLLPSASAFSIALAKSASTLLRDIAELLLLALLARGVARVALELLLEFDALEFFACAELGSLARDLLELQLLEPRRLVGGLARDFRGLLLGLALCALGLALARDLQDPAALGLTGEHGGIIGIIFRTRQEFSAIALRALAAAS